MTLEWDKVVKKMRLIRSVHLMAVQQAVIEKKKRIVLLGFPVIFCIGCLSLYTSLRFYYDATNGKGSAVSGLCKSTGPLGSFVVPRCTQGEHINATQKSAWLYRGFEPRTILTTVNLQNEVN